MTSLREKYPIVPFAGSNFSTWAFRIRSILKENGVIKAIEDENFSRIDANSAYEAKAQAILIAGVADSHIEYLKKETAFAMFKNLEDNFKKKGVRSKLFLRRKLSEMNYTEKYPLIEHFTRMEEIFTELKDCDTSLSEEEKVNYILLSMPKAYEGIITALETMENLKLDFVKNRLLGEEEKRKKDISDSGSMQYTSAFSCFVCGKPGHKKYQCTMRNRNQQERGNYQPIYGNYQRGRGNNRNRGRGYNGGFRRGQGHSQGRGGQAYAAENEGSSQDVVFLCENTEVCNCDVSNENKLVWCVDSGSSDHLVNNKEVFMDYLELKVPKNIAVAKDGVMLQAVGIGNTY